MFESTYIEKLNQIVDKGEDVEGRNGGTRKLPFLDIAFDASTLPLLHSRRSHLKGIVGEYAAFLRPITNVSDFEAFDCNYWKKWADDDGSIRVDYGNTWRDWNGYNQIDAVLEGLRSDPNGRRHLISAWKPDTLAQLSLPCCHYSYQFYVRGGQYLDMLWTQRSADWCIGVPADAVLATIMLNHFAQHTGFQAGNIKMSFGDCHVYSNHLELVEKQLANYAGLSDIPTVAFEIQKREDFYSFQPTDVTVLSTYEPLESISYELNA